MSVNKIQVLLLILIINSITFNRVYSKKCKHKEYECVDKQRCIPRSHICNGIKDCRDSSDENKCSTMTSTISSIISSTMTSTIDPTITHTSILDLFLKPRKGHIIGNSHTVYNHIGLLELCATLCIHTPSCQSINYIESYEQCHLNSQIFGDIGVEFIGDLGSVYYSKIYSSTSSIKFTSSSTISSSTTSTHTSSSTISSSTTSTITSSSTTSTINSSSTISSSTTSTITSSSTISSSTKSTITSSSTISSSTTSINILPSTSLTVISDKIIKQKNNNNYTIYIIPISIVIVIGVIVLVVIKKQKTKDFRDRIVTNYNNTIYRPRPTHIVKSTDNIYLTPYTNASEIYEPIHNYEEINT